MQCGLLSLHIYAVINCGGLTDPEDGQIMFTPGVVATIDTGFNATATYSCSVGYDLSGGGIRTCQSDGQWDGVEIVCLRKFFTFHVINFMIIGGSPG